MSRKRFTTEQIINIPREAEVRLSQGQTVGEICRLVGVSEQSYYRWRKAYGGLKLDQARRLKDLERERGIAQELYSFSRSRVALSREEGRSQATPSRSTSLTAGFLVLQRSR